MIPSSALRSPGAHPPQSNPAASAASSAPRSTPVCPPETILLSVVDVTAVLIPAIHVPMNTTRCKGARGLRLQPQVLIILVQRENCRHRETSGTCECGFAHGLNRSTDGALRCMNMMSH